MGYEKIMKTWKLGFMGVFYENTFLDIPKEERPFHLIRRSAELGCRCVDFNVEFDAGEDGLKRLRECSLENDVELELRTPKNFWELSGASGKEARKALERQIDVMDMLGADVMHGAFGHLTIPYSRYHDGGREIEKDLEFMAANLRIAGEILQERGKVLGLENHCDFTAREYVRLFEMVDSPVIGCALDTANGYSVYFDPDEEIQLLAPWTFTTHIKDMKMKQETVMTDRMPFYPVGVAVGEGNVNIPLALETLVRKARIKEGLHIIIECGWEENTPEDLERMPAHLIKRKMFEDSLAWLQKYIKQEEK